jgi:hypothetical protein
MLVANGFVTNSDCTCCIVINDLFLILYFYIKTLILPIKNEIIYYTNQLNLYLILLFLFYYIKCF